MSPLRAKIGNAVGFQAAWLACVAGAARGHEWLGPGVVALLAAAFLAGTRPRGRALALLAAAAVLGAIVDGMLIALGRLQFTSAAGGPAHAAPWMIALWIAFATTLPWSLSFLRGRLLLAAVLGVPAGAGAYWAGAQVGAVVLPDPLAASLASVGLAWGASLPALVALSERMLPREQAPAAAA